MKTLLISGLLFISIITNAQDYSLTELMPGMLPPAKGNNFDHGDIDNDGDIDFIVIGDSNNQLGTGCYTRIYINNGTGNFTPSLATGLPDLGEGLGLSFVRLVDVNNDQKLDVYLSGNDNSSQIDKIFRNEGNMTFTEIPQTSNGIWTTSDSKLDFGDLDGDGDLDLVIAKNQNGPYTRILLNDGNGDFSQAPNSPITFDCGGIVEIGDVDGDGDSDILLSGTNPLPASTTRLLINDGTANFTTSTGFPTLSTYAHGGFIDMENDGDLDILLSGYNFFRVFINGGSGNYTELPTLYLANIIWPEVAIGDINADGADDLLIGGYNNVSQELVTKIFTNDWNFGFIESTTNIPIVAGQENRFHLANLDTDPYLEILSSKWFDYTGLYDIDAFLNVEKIDLDLVTVYPNPSNGNFLVSIPEIDTQADIEIFDVAGRLIYSEPTKTAFTKIDLGRQSGIFTIRISTNSGSTQKQLVLY